EVDKAVKVEMSGADYRDLPPARSRQVVGQHGTRNSVHVNNLIGRRSTQICASPAAASNVSTGASGARSYKLVPKNVPISVNDTTSVVPQIQGGEASPRPIRHAASAASRNSNA